jgi:hypothetical protein
MLRRLKYLPKYRTFFLFEERKSNKRFNNSYKESGFSRLFCCIPTPIPSGIYVILMNCFGTRKASSSWRVMLMEKQDMQLYRERC